MSNQVEVPEPPTDAISAVRFFPDAASQQRFAVASWDRHAYVYEIDENKSTRLVSKHEHQAPVLDVCFGKDGNQIFTASLDWNVRAYNVTTGDSVVLSSHSMGVRNLVYSPAHDLVISASWDKTLHVHRDASSSTPTVASILLQAKPFAVSLSATKLIVAMSERALHIYDLASIRTALDSVSQSSNNLQDRLPEISVEPWQRRESSLRFMTRAVASMPNDEGYATSSIEGRVAVEWFDPSTDSQSRKYAFKCHRQSDEKNGDDVVYPVNALAFHPVHGTFATGGGDGTVAIWDAVAKRRIKNYPKLGGAENTSVAALDFSADGEFLVTAISPGFGDGNDVIQEGSVAIYVKQLEEKDVKRKAK